MFASEKKQGKTVQKMETSVSAGSRRTGIPNPLKSYFEASSGYSFDDVRVHYRSEKPAQISALAYTRGNEVYMGPGQERYLPHELGHVVQQKQGRVSATSQVAGMPLNDSPALEHEADLLGRGK